MNAARQTLRHRAILERMARDGRQDVEALAQALGVTGMTIRRDLRQLEREGLLLRTHGGCVPQDLMVRELSFSEKSRRWVEEKVAIAQCVLPLLERRMALYLDTGTTAVQVARFLPADQDLRVFTPNLRVAHQLFGRPGFEVVVFGGVLAPHSPDLIGDLALARLNEFRFDLVLLGADALDPETGEFFATEQPSAALSRVALRQGRRAYLLANSGKLEESGLAAIGRLGAEVGLITDEGAPASALTRFRRLGAKVIVAQGAHPGEGVSRVRSPRPRRPHGGAFQGK